jgi:hypothetical protein
MVEELKSLGVNHGLFVSGASVTLVGPGAPMAVSPTNYDSADVIEAVNAGLLRKIKMSVSGAGYSWAFEMYVPKME